MDDDDNMDEPKIEDEDPFEGNHNKKDIRKAADKVDREPRKADIFNDPLLPEEPKQ